MSRPFENVTVFWAGTQRGMRVGVLLGKVEHVLDEEEARRLLANLAGAVEAAWPSPTHDPSKNRNGI